MERLAALARELAQGTQSKGPEDPAAPEKSEAA
jgi:hypothetical protein